MTWSKLREAATKVAGPGRVLAVDLVGVAGVASAVHGVALIYQPAAWILAGLAAVATALILNTKRKP